MQQQFDKRDRGALFKNDRRERETQPEYTGSINIGGEEYWLSAWVKEGRSGKFLSLSATPKETRPVEKSADLASIGDDMPF